MTEAFGNFSVLPPAAAEWLLSNRDFTTQDRVIPITVTDDHSISRVAEQLVGDHLAILIIQQAGTGYCVLSWPHHNRGYFLQIKNPETKPAQRFHEPEKLFNIINNMRKWKMWLVPGSIKRMHLRGSREEASDSYDPINTMDTSRALLLINSRIEQVVETALEMIREYARTGIHNMKIGDRSRATFCPSVVHVVSQMWRIHESIRLNGYRDRVPKHMVVTCLQQVTEYHEILKKGKVG